MSENNFVVKKDPYDERDFIYEDQFAITAEDFKIPSSYDILYKTPEPKSQHGLGTCVSQAACAYKSMLENNKDLELSPMFLYYFSRILDGTDTSRDVGTSIRSAMKALRKWGVCVESLFPYQKENLDTYPPLVAMDEAKNHKIDKYFRLRDGLFTIKHYIYKHEMPVLCAINMYEGSRSKSVGETGILGIPKKHDTIIARHALLCVGFHDATPSEKIGGFFTNRTTKGTLVCLNSWGDFGNNGLLYVPYEYVFENELFDAWVIE